MMSRLWAWVKGSWDAIAIWAVSAWISLMIVIFAPPVAAGFIGVPFTSHVENQYWKIVVGFFVSLGAYFLLMNLAEIALVLTTFQTKKVVDHFLKHVRENLEGKDDLPSEMELAEQF